MNNQIICDQVFLAHAEDELLLIYDDEINFHEEPAPILEDVWKSEDDVTPEEILVEVEGYGALQEVEDTPIVYEISDSENEMTPEENVEKNVTYDVDLSAIIQTCDIFHPEKLLVYIHGQNFTFPDSGFFAEQCDNLNALNVTYNTIWSQTFSHSPGEVTDVTDLILHRNHDFIFQAHSPPSIPSLYAEHCPRHRKTTRNVFWADMEEVSCILLHSAAAHVEPPAYVHDDTVTFVAKGLTLAKEYMTDGETLPSGPQSIGRLVAAIVMDRKSAVVMAYAVNHFVPQTLTDDNTGEVSGLTLNNIIRGFAINDHFRRIIIEKTCPVLPVVNQIPN
ncbi:uncharacterized protein LOC6614121 [Drosophila sechellia]|uniref:GM10900 n=1 Tax=Drosophila sechellia TaxID=7238 RepID=B4I4G8_DROSE|nr:uncharacterized protein LOC6614121 [Drosophila sechellia]EDW55111.1 GM10900 [Drosophila sechellia]